MKGFKPNAKMSSTCHYSYGGAVMKKAKGGIARGEDMNDEKSVTLRMEKMPSGAQQYVRGATRPEKFETIRKYTDFEGNKLKPGSADFDETEKKAYKLLAAEKDNTAAFAKEVAAKKARGGAMKQSEMDKAKQAYQSQIRRNPRDTGIALGPDDRPLGMPQRPKGPMMGAPVKPVLGMGVMGPRNPTGPRKPMGSPSPMSGGVGAALSSLFKGPMARKKGGMTKGMK